MQNTSAHLTASRGTNSGPQKNTFNDLCYTQLPVADASLILEFQGDRIPLKNTQFSQ